MQEKGERRAVHAPRQRKQNTLALSSLADFRNGLVDELIHRPALCATTYINYELRRTADRPWCAPLPDGTEPHKSLSRDRLRRPRELPLYADDFEAVWQLGDAISVAHPAWHRWL